jgi:hypothetical protein
MLGGIPDVRLDGVSPATVEEGLNLIKPLIAGHQDAQRTPSLRRCPLLGVTLPDVRELECDAREVAPPGALNLAFVAAGVRCAHVAWPMAAFFSGQLLACSSGAHGLNSAPNHPKIEHDVQSKHFYMMAHCKAKNLDGVRT